MSLPCCYTSDTTPFCESRRLGEMPMCLHHTKKTLRLAILDGHLPMDCMSELIQLTDWFVKVKEMNLNYERGRMLSQYHAEQKHEERRRVAEDSVVYYVRLTGSRIKIGWTSNLDQRLRAYRSQASDLLAVEPGGQPVEARRHKQFAHLRIGRSEDFHEDPTLLAHIEALRDAA